MIILTTELEQAFTVIPKKSSWTTFSVQLQNETTKAISILNIDNSYFYNDLMQIFFSITLGILKENEFYNLTIFIDDDSQKVIYKDRVFVTNQPETSYSINSGQYTTPAIDNNNYITI